MSDWHSLTADDIAALLPGVMAWVDKGRRTMDIKYESNPMGQHTVWAYDYDVQEGRHLDPTFDVSTLDEVLAGKRAEKEAGEKERLEHALADIAKRLEEL